MAKKNRIKIGAMYREYGKYEVCGMLWLIKDRF